MSGRIGGVSVDELRSLGVEASAGNDPALVRERAQARVIRLVTSDRQHFQHAANERLMRLMRLWDALVGEGRQEFPR